MNKKILNTFVFAAVAAFSGMASANGYLGASVGVADPEGSDFKDDNGFRLTGGVPLNENFSFEVSYTDLGEFKAEDSTLNLLSMAVGASVSDASVEVTGFEFSLVGQAPLTENLSIFGRAGVYMWDVDLKVTFTGVGSGSDSDDGTDPVIGVGLMYSLSDSVKVLGSYDRYEAFDGDVDYASLGLRVGF